MHIAQIGQSMSDGIEILRPQRSILAELVCGHRVVEYEARAADEVPMAAVVHRAIVLEVMEEPARRIDAARVVERHRARDVRAQEFGRTEIRRGHVGFRAMQ